jgi:hypothetical protein
MYIVRIDDAKSRKFSTRKSARSKSRRAIERGASFVAIFERRTNDETNEIVEGDTLKNVYTFVIDDVTKSRRHRRIEIDDWNAYVRANAKTRNA